MLGSIRSGRCSPQGSVVEQLQGRCGQALDTADGILPTKVRPVGDLPLAKIVEVNYSALSLWCITVANAVTASTSKCCMKGTPSHQLEKSC